MFVTNYSDFYQRAFVVYAFEYIVKPIEENRLYKILDEIRRYRENDCQARERFKGTQGVIKAKVGDICYFEFVDRRLFIWPAKWCWKVDR